MKSFLPLLILLWIACEGEKTVIIERYPNGKIKHEQVFDTKFDIDSFQTVSDIQYDIHYWKDGYVKKEIGYFNKDNHATSIHCSVSGMGEFYINYDIDSLYLYTEVIIDFQTGNSVEIIWDEAFGGTGKMYIVTFQGDINEKSTFVTYLGVTDSFKNDHKRGTTSNIDNPFILFVGERKGYKNFNCLLDAFCNWKMRNEIKLIAVGKPWDYEEEAYITDKGINKRVEVISSISDDELAGLYSASEAVVHPSLYEGFGFPIVESMATGSKLVASDIPTTREIAGDIPIYFDQNDSTSLIEALNIAVEKQLTEKEVSDIGQHAFQYNWDNTARETIKVYKSL